MIIYKHEVVHNLDFASRNYGDSAQNPRRPDLRSTCQGHRQVQRHTE